VTATSKTTDTSTNNAIEIDTATNSEAAIATAT
jgi:hypothetical protein